MHNLRPSGRDSFRVYRSVLFGQNCRRGIFAVVSDRYQPTPLRRTKPASNTPQALPLPPSYALTTGSMPVLAAGHLPRLSLQTEIGPNPRRSFRTKTTSITLDKNPDPPWLIYPHHRQPTLQEGRGIFHTDQIRVHQFGQTPRPSLRQIVPAPCLKPFSLRRLWAENTSNTPLRTISPSIVPDKIRVHQAIALGQIPRGSRRTKLIHFIHRGGVRILSKTPLSRASGPTERASFRPKRASFCPGTCINPSNTSIIARNVV